jgi:hypothetical protein
MKWRSDVDSCYFFDVICLVVGASGYANTSFLLTSLLRPRTAELLYSESHIRTRNVVERCFGMLKRMFPILACGCKLQINKVLIIIVATSVLHNICLEANDIDAPPAPEEINEQDLEVQINKGQIAAVEGVEAPVHYGTREMLIEYFANL